MTILSFRYMGVLPQAEMATQIENIRHKPGRGAWLPWTRIDARAAMRACRLGVEATQDSSGPYNITGAQVVLNGPAQDLVPSYFGVQTEISDGLSGQASPFSCRRANVAFGYEPQFVWSESKYHPKPN